MTALSEGGNVPFIEKRKQPSSRCSNVLICLFFVAKRRVRDIRCPQRRRVGLPAGVEMAVHAVHPVADVRLRVALRVDEHVLPKRIMSPSGELGIVSSVGRREGDGASPAPAESAPGRPRTDGGGAQHASTQASTQRDCARRPQPRSQLACPSAPTAAAARRTSMRLRFGSTAGSGVVAVIVARLRRVELLVALRALDLPRELLVGQRRARACPARPRRACAAARRSPP